MTTDAHDRFQVNIRRPQRLLEMFDAGSLKPRPGQRRTAGQPTTRENELLRAAVIITIGALDAYLSDVAVEVMVAQLEAAEVSDDSRAVLKRVLKELDTLALELALVTSHEERRTLVSNALLDHFTHKVSNHGAKGVSATVGRMGKKFDWNALDEDMPENLAYASDPSTAAGVLDSWTHRRHQLVHQGRALKITSPRAKALITFVELLVDEVDGVAQSAL